MYLRNEWEDSVRNGADETDFSDLTEVLEEIEFVERERTDRQVVELAILLYNHGDESSEGFAGAWVARRRAISRGDLELDSEVRPAISRRRSATSCRPAGRCLDGPDGDQPAHRRVHAVCGGRPRNA